jgi:hypothetical protein
MYCSPHPHDILTEIYKGRINCSLQNQNDLLLEKSIVTAVHTTDRNEEKDTKQGLNQIVHPHYQAHILPAAVMMTLHLALKHTHNIIIVKPGILCRLLPRLNCNFTNAYLY